MNKRRLFTPGPTPVPETTQLDMARPLVHHRGPEFKAILAEVQDGLKYLFQTRDDVLILTSSGTGAMEATVVNLLSPGDPVLTVQGGKFGERWTEICQAYGLNTQVMEVEWGKAVDPEELGQRLRENSAIKAVFITHNETSTGVMNDLEAIAGEVHRNSDALLVIDGISSVGALELRTDRWGLDVVLTSSQKGLMIPPGLALVSISQRAWKATEGAKLPKYYFSFAAARKALERWETPFTPAITLVIGLHSALQLIEEEGIEQVWARHRRLAQATRAGIKALGLELFAQSPSDALTAVKVPPGVDGLALVERLRTRYGIAVAGGQDQLRGKIFRIAHLGYYDDFDVITAISALEMALQDLGWEFEPGTGVQAAQAKLLSNFLLGEVKPK